MPTGLSRELQRHYITFRDYLIRSGQLGVRVDATRYDDAEWVRTDDGFQKKIYVENGSCDGVALHSDLTGQFLPAAEFDDLVDQRLALFMRDSRIGSQDQRRVLDEWLEREGRESYLYGTASSVVDMISSAGQVGGLRKFEIEHPKDHQVIERDFYTSYLRRVLGRSALSDKKLMIRFKRV